ncbi:hypothetical protein C0J52_07453 [Blattella germanica]|nr:hypothetical protein C0J52_07453 [Blattella germanica]
MLFQTLIRPMVTYSVKTWVLNKEDENAIRIFERKIIKRIYGPDLVRFMKSLRLRWIGHVERMEDGRMPKRLIHNDIVRLRKRGRPRKSDYKI